MVAACQPVLWVNGIVPGCINAFAHWLRLQWMPLPTVLAHGGAPCLPIKLYHSQLHREKVKPHYFCPCMRAAIALSLGCQIRDSA